MAARVWGAGTGPMDGKWSTATNWTGDVKPQAGDDVTFNGTDVTNCDIDENTANLGSLTATAAYTGTLDGATSDSDVTVAGDVTLDCTRVDMGDGTWIVSGNWDNKDVTTFNANQAPLTMDGAAKTYSSLTNKVKWLNIDGTISITLAGIHTLPDILNINNGKTLTIGAGVTFNDGGQFLGAGNITGAGTIIAIDTNWTNYSGYCDVASLVFERAATLSAITWGSAAVSFPHNNAAVQTVTFLAGTITFEGDVTIDNNYVQAYTIDNAANNPNIIFEGSLTITETGGAVTWAKGTGTITFSGAGAGTQDIALLGKTVEDIVMNDAGATKRISAAGFTTDSLTLTAGTWDTITNNPNFTVIGAIAIAVGITYNDGTGTITLAGSGAGVQDINLGTKTVEAVVINDAGATKRFTAAGTMESLRVINGSFNPNGQTLGTTAAFIIDAGGLVKETGLPGTTLNIGGNMDIRGTMGSFLGLDSAGAWTLNVTVLGEADYVQVRNSNAAGGVTIQAQNSQDLGGNVNWNFVSEAIETYTTGRHRRHKRRIRYPGRR